MSNKPRVQVQNLKSPPKLRPAARPVDTFVKPANPIPTSVVMSDGLSRLVRSLEPFMESKHQEAQAKNKQRMEDAAAGRIEGLTFDEAQQLRQEGTLAEHDDPWYTATLDRQYGMKMARWRKDDLMSRVQGLSTTGDGQPTNTIDLSSVDIEELLAETIREDLESLPEGMPRNAYLGKMEAVQGSLLSASTHEKAKAAKAYAADGVFESLLEEAELGLTSGEPASVVHGKMQSHFSMNSKLLGISPAEQNQEMLRAAAVLAEQGKVELVHEILYGKRKGVPGLLGKTRENAVKAASILEVATRESEKINREKAFQSRLSFKDAVSNGSLDEEQLGQFRKGNPGAVTQAEAESWITQSHQIREKALLKAQHAQAYQKQQQLLNSRLIQVGDQGKAHLLEDMELLTPEGKQKSITGDKQREMLADLYLSTEIPGEQPEQRFSRLVDTFSRNGLVHKGWKQVLNKGFMSASPSSLSGGVVPTSLRDGFELYLQLHAMSPQYLGSLIGSAKARDFYSLMRTATEHGGESLEAAALSALEITKGVREGADDTTRRLHTEQVKELIAELEDTNYDGWFSEPESIGNISGIAQNLLQYYVRKGVQPDDALEITRDRMQEDYSSVHGWLVRTAGMPSGFPDVAESFLKEAAVSLDVEPEDLALSPLGDAQGVYAVVLKSGHQYQSLNGQRVFGLTDMMQHDEARQQRIAKEKAEEINLRNTKKLIKKKPKYHLKGVDH